MEGEKTQEREPRKSEGGRAVERETEGKQGQE